MYIIWRANLVKHIMLSANIHRPSRVFFCRHYIPSLSDQFYRYSTLSYIFINLLVQFSGFNYFGRVKYLGLGNINVLWVTVFADYLGLYEKGRDLTQSYDKSPNTHRKPQKASWQHTNDITIADWLRTVSWGNDNHPTGVVKRVYGILTFPLTTKAVLLKGHTFKNL